MKMLRWFWLVLMCSALTLCVTACRDDDPAPVSARHLELRDDTRLSRPPPHQTEDTSHQSTNDRGRTNGPGGLKLPKSPPPYVTDLQLTAGCEVNPQNMAVTYSHAEPSLCEHIVLTSIRSDENGTYEVATPVKWHVTDTAIASLNCLNGPQDNFCWAVGHQDPFDLDTDAETMTTVTACVANACPQPPVPDCLPMLCTSVDVASVINLEGTWSFTAYGITPEQPIHFLQDGRFFQGLSFGIKKGVVHGRRFSFEIGDYIYAGFASPDRDHLHGFVVDMISNTVTSELSAVRLSL